MRFKGWSSSVLRVGALWLLAWSVACSKSAEIPHNTAIDAAIPTTSAQPDAGVSGSDSGMEPKAAGSTHLSPTVQPKDAGATHSDSSMQQPEDAGVLPSDSTPPPPEHVAHVIFDSDMSSDWDDVGDIAVLHGLASFGQIDILAMAVSSLNGATAMCMDAINTFYGKPDIPIGVRPDVGGVGGYPAQIASEFPHGPEKAPGDFPLAIDVYRKVLAAQPDKSVTIVTTGLLTNLKALLLSGPDKYSPLSGKDLVAKKVKLYSCAGGAFPSGDEFNFRASGDDSAYVVLNNWPSQIMYVGFDIGQVIQTAGRLPDAPANNPIRRVYVDIEKQHPYPSWGQIAVYYAARPSEGLWGTVTKGHNTVEMSGHNAWATDSDPSGDLEQGYMLEKVRSPVREALDALIMLPPNNGTPSQPGDPSNLRATIVDSKHVELQWTDNAFNEGGFKVERGINGVYTVIGSVAANVTHFSDTGLASAANVAYRVKAFNPTGDSHYSSVWVYSGWTEVNFVNPDDPPLYTYYQSCDLRWARGGDFRPDHVALNNDSQHGQSVAIGVDVGALGSEGAFSVYFLYQDSNNWYRLTTDGSKSIFEKKIGGTTTQIGGAGAGVSIGNGSRLEPWQIESSSAGAMKFSANGAMVLEVSEPLQLTSGKIGLGGAARTPVWENFHFETRP